MGIIKREFEEVVRDNNSWLFAYVKSKTQDKNIAEDLLQEIWIKAYKAYDSYCEDGKIKSWLMRIAQNHIYSYFSRCKQVNFLSLDTSGDDENDSIYAYLSDGLTPEESYIEKELMENVLSVIEKLPASQQQIIRYRFIDGYSVYETSEKMNIPAGSVKSKTYYALNTIRKALNVQIGTKKGATLMDCKDIYKYLFVYAKGIIDEENKKKVEEHISKCDICNGVVKSLQKLIPTMTYGLDDELTHFLIAFPDLKLSYTGIRYEVPNYEELNKYLDEWGGNIPENETWFTSGHASTLTSLGCFDNEGNEIKRVVFAKEGDNIVIEKNVFMKKVYHISWEYNVMFHNDSTYRGYRQSEETPNLYYGKTCNHFGSAVKSALYKAVPAKAENVRIKRGNGVIDCGTYKFPYVDRYVAEGEKINLEFSFILND